MNHGPTKDGSFIVVSTTRIINSVTFLRCSFKNRNVFVYLLLSLSLAIFLLQDAAKVCCQFMKRDSDEVRFSAVALCKA